MGCAPSTARIQKDSRQAVDESRGDGQIYAAAARRQEERISEETGSASSAIPGADGDNAEMAQANLPDDEGHKDVIEIKSKSRGSGDVNGTPAIDILKPTEVEKSVEQQTNLKNSEAESKIISREQPDALKQPLGQPDESDCETIISDHGKISSKDEPLVKRGDYPKPRTSDRRQSCFSRESKMGPSPSNSKWNAVSNFNTPRERDIRNYVKKNQPKIPPPPPYSANPPPYHKIAKQSELFCNRTFLKETPRRSSTGWSRNQVDYNEEIKIKKVELKQLEAKARNVQEQKEWRNTIQTLVQEVESLSPNIPETTKSDEHLGDKSTLGPASSTFKINEKPVQFNSRHGSSACSRSQRSSTSPGTASSRSWSGLSSKRGGRNTDNFSSRFLSSRSIDGFNR